MPPPTTPSILSLYSNESHGVASSSLSLSIDDPYALPLFLLFYSVETKVQPASSSAFLSSPDWNDSIMMSAPPVNSPSTYSCGIVGQLEYSCIFEARSRLLAS